MVGIFLKSCGLIHKMWGIGPILDTSPLFSFLIYFRALCEFQASLASIYIFFLLTSNLMARYDFIVLK